jgi:molybdopterin-binding protein
MPPRRSFVKLSAGYCLKGRVFEVKKGANAAHVRLDVNGTTVAASITNEAVDEFGLKAGHDAYAIIKASDVMVGLDG